jgi:hypothetical protein
VSEVQKARLNRGLQGAGFFIRDARGFEIDLMLDVGARLVATEIKSGQTIASDFFTHLEGLEEMLPRTQASREIEARVVYGGSDRQRRRRTDVVPWNQVKDLSWW